jgi:hypothetical protein
MRTAKERWQNRQRQLKKQAERHERKMKNLQELAKRVRERAAANG